MGKSWRILTKRYGEDVRDPSVDQITAAVDELFDPNTVNDTEHSEIIFRYGVDEGPMYVLSVALSGVGTYEKWADSDFISRLTGRQIANVTAERARALLHRLASGEVEII